MHEKRIEIRWRDMDAFGHVNNAVYLNYLEEVRDEWLERALGTEADLWHFVLARVAIDYRRELRQDDDIVVATCRLGRLGRSSIGTREELQTLDGTVSARAESVMVARDPASGASRALTDAERAALLREDDEGGD
jgi:acyl-CoA thioester hydrolase